MRGDRFSGLRGHGLMLPIGAVIAIGAGAGVAPLVIGSLLVAVGLSVRMSPAPDVHSHVCDSCGNTWTHCGRSSAGLEAPHTCQRCGAIQWWRAGEREVIHGQMYGRTMDGQ